MCTLNIFRSDGPGSQELKLQRWPVLVRKLPVAAPLPAAANTTAAKRPRPNLWLKLKAGVAWLSTMSQCVHVKLLEILHGFQVQFHWLHKIVCFSCTEQGGKPKAKKKPAPVSTKRGPSLESIKTLKDGKYIGFMIHGYSHLMIHWSSLINPAKTRCCCCCCWCWCWQEMRLGTTRRNLDCFTA